MKERRLGSLGTGVLLLTVLLLSALVCAEMMDAWAQRIKEEGPRNLTRTLLQPLVSLSRSTGLSGLYSTLHQGFKEFADSRALPFYFSTPDFQVRGKAAREKRDEVAAAILALQPKEVVYTKDRPLKVLMIGDSMAGLYTAQAFRNAVRDYPAMDLDIFQKVSSNLSETNTFNWPVEIQRVFSQKEYDAIFVLLGSNDAQSIRMPDGRAINYGTEEWFSEHRNRVNSFLQTLTEHSKKVYWTAVPPMKLPGYKDRMKTLNELAAAICSGFDKVRFLTLDDLLGDANKQYTDVLPVDGRLQVVRTSDFIHMSYPGALLVIRRFLDNIGTDFPSAVKLN